jgi:ubiquinone/menaquinone biosynthesis C-methylase UbiE
MTNLPQLFHNFEYQGWQKSVAQYHTCFGILTNQSIEQLLNSVNTIAGIKLLDIATGPGYVAAIAHQRQCHVIDLDFSEAMLEKAREIHPDVEFQQGDASNLPFEDHIFDAVVMNFGILHLAEPDRAIEEAFRVLHSQGKFAFSVWEGFDKSIGLRIVHEAIQTYGNLDIALPEGPPFFRFSNREHSMKSLQDAGFINPVIETVAMTWQLENAAQLFDAFYQGTARTGGILRSQPPENLNKIREAVYQASSSYVTNDNRLVIPMSCLIASAQKP